MINGCDLSHHQGKKIDFAKMKAKGIDFVFIKATDFALPKTNGVDENFYLNVDKAKKADLLVGAYHWWTCDSKFNSMEQAYLFHSIAEQVELDLPPMLDVERGGNPKELWTARLYAMVRMVEDLFLKTPTIYTSNGIWKNTAVNYDWAENYPLFLAWYNPLPPLIPRPWMDYTFLQYKIYVNPITKDATDYGINRYEARALDLDYFNGSIEELKAL